MTRTVSNTDFHVTVDGIGTFSFARRTMRDELRISAEYSRLTEGVETPTAYLANVAGWIATLKVLTVSAPDGWNIDEMDPLDDDTYTKLKTVFACLRVKEDSFRPAKKQGSETPGT